MKLLKYYYLKNSSNLLYYKYHLIAIDSNLLTALKYWNASQVNSTHVLEEIQTPEPGNYNATSIWNEFHTQRY